MTARMTNRRFEAALATAVSALLLSGCAVGHQRTYSASGDPGQGPIVIGTDNSAESRVVAALYEQLLTAAGEKAEIANGSYGTPADTAKAVTAGTLTLVPAYETTLLRAFPGTQTLAGNMAATLSMALPPGTDALPSAAAQRGVVLAVSPATAQRYGLHGIGDLAEVQGGVTLGGTAAQDPDAPSAAVLSRAYGVTIEATSTVEVLVLRSTDPAITRDGLTVLSDPAGVIPPEHVFPLINADYAGKATRTALTRLNSALTTDQLAVLASAVTGGENPDQVAATWLRAKGLAH